MFSLLESQIKVVLKWYSRYCSNHYDFSVNDRNALRHSNRKPSSNEVEINDDLWVFVCSRILIFIFPHLRSDVWKNCFTRSVMFQIHSIYFESASQLHRSNIRVRILGVCLDGAPKLYSDCKVLIHSTCWN